MEALVVLAVFVAIVWGGVVFLRGGLLAGAMAVLLAGICFWYPPLDLSVGSIPLTPERVLWAVLMVQFLVWWRQGWIESAGVKQEDGHSCLSETASLTHKKTDRNVCPPDNAVLLTESGRISRTEILLLTFMAVLAVSVFSNDWNVNRSQPASRFLFFYLMPLGMYWVGSRARITRRALITMFVLLAVFGLYLALTAIAETRGPASLVFPRFIMSSDFPEFLGRSRGPLLNPAANGLLMGSCLAAGLLLWPLTPRWGRLALLAFAAIVGFGIYLTLTRSVWMGGLLGVGIVLLLVLPRLYRPWLVAAAVLGSTVFVATQWENLVAFKRDQNLSARETELSAKLRPVLAAIAWQMFCDRPLLGCGLGHYTDQHVYYLADRSSAVVLEQGRDYVQHNVWLSLLTETGLVGVTLFTLLLIAWLRCAWRLWQTTDAPLWMRRQGLLFLVVAANYVINGMFHDMTIIQMMHMFLFFMAGITVNLETRARRPAA